MLLMILGLILIALGIIILLQNPAKRENPESTYPKEKKGEKTEIKGGAVIMMGPIPIVVGSDSKTAMLMMLIALMIMLIWVLAIRGW